MIQQVLVNGIIEASKILLVGVSFAMIFNVTRFFHFAHGIVFTSGAYFALLFRIQLGLPLWLSALLGIFMSVVLGGLMEIAVYRPFRRRKSPELVLLLVSLGVYILLQNIISISFGDETQSIRGNEIQEGLCFWGIRITPIQIMTICISLLFVVTLSFFLRISKTGKTMRAVANDPKLANIVGINSSGIILSVFAIGSALAGLAGILLALDIDMTPTMGMNVLMLGVIAVIIGGANNIYGIALGALLLATAQHLGSWFIGAQWQDVISFATLVLFLLLKPEGFFGYKSKSTTV